LNRCGKEERFGSAFYGTWAPLDVSRRSTKREEDQMINREDNQPEEESLPLEHIGEIFNRQQESTPGQSSEEARTMMRPG